MNLAHIHLLLNHFPTIGFGLGLGLFFVSLFAKNEELKRASLVILFVIAVIAIPTYLSGAAALDKLCERVGGVIKCPPGLSLTLIQEHEDWALLAFSLMEITGFFAFIGIWQMRRTPKLQAWNATVILLLAIISFGVMSIAATEGGRIRHPEIQSAEDIATAQAADRVPTARAIGAFVISKTWLWPTCETLHFVGLCLLFVAVIFVNLRVLGLITSVSFAAVYQLLPLGILGFGINLVTGMLFFLAAPQQYVNNVEFHRKMIFVVLAGFNVLYFMLFDKAWKLGAGEDAPVSSKVAAAISIYLWVGILYYGEMLPFLGNSF
jgi:hypothetical protein